MLLLGVLVPFGEARAQQSCGADVTPDGTAGSCPVGSGDSGGGPLDPASPNDPGSAGANPLAPRPTVGNPVSLFTGNKQETETDFSLPGAELAFRRFYNGANENFRRGVGQGWSHTYAVTLFASPDGGRELVQGDGRRLYFEVAGTDDDGRAIFRTGSAFEGTLVTLADGEHRWELPDGRRLRFDGSYLVEIDWPDQRNLSLYYRSRRLESVTDETGRVLRFAYWPGAPGAGRALGGYDAQDFGAAPGQLASVTLPDGSGIAYEYDERSNLTRVTYPDGTHRQYHYEDETYRSHLTGLTDRTGVRFSTWRYDKYGRAISSEHAGGVERVTLEHPEVKAIEAGQTVATVVTDSLGRESLYTWEQPVGGSPRLLEATGPGCASCPPTGMRWRYDAAGRLSEATITGKGAAVGTGTVSYAYDDTGRLAEVRRTTPNGTSVLVERREYATATDLQPMRIARPSVNPDGERVTEFERDGRGLVTAVTERGWAPVGVPERSEVSAGSPAPVVSGEADTADALAPNGYVPVERTVRYGHERGALVSVDGPREDVEDIARFERDELNRLIAVETPLSPALRMTGFDALGRVTSFRVGTQSPVTIAYDPNGRPARIEQRGRPLTFGYDAETRLTSFTGPDGATTRLIYGASGDLVELIDAAGRRTTFDIDDEGRTTGQVELGPDGTMIRSVATLFDALGRVASTTTERAAPAGGNPVPEIRQNEYDEQGRLASVTDAASGNRVELARDDFGRLAAVTEPDGTDIAFEHDRIGQEIALVDARQNRTAYLKDDFGRVVVHVGPDTGTTTYRYDAAGNRVERRDGNGIVTRYAWDAANRLIEKAGPEATYRYVYDPTNGRLVESRSPATTERFGFDAEFRLIEHERIIDGQGFTTTYRYDDEGRIETKGLPDGQSLRYHYREDGPRRGTLRAITRESFFGFSQETLVGEIDTDESDGSTGHVSHNGLRTHRDHAPDGTVTSLAIDEALRLEYEFDEAGRIIGIDANGARSDYRWTRAGLVGADTSTGVYRFDYDVAGNRTASSVARADGGTEATTYRYPETGGGNRLLGADTLVIDGTDGRDADGSAGDAAVAVQSSADEYRYDAVGSPLAARDGLSYEYDADHRPIAVRENGTLLAEYAYNGFGERIRKVVYRGDAKRVTYFLYDGHQLTAEIDATPEGAAGEMRQSVFIGEAPVAYLVGRKIYAVHADPLGTPRIATDDEGRTVWAADYDPFGRAEVTVGEIELPYRLPGQYEDAETGTHYNYYRDYDPATGRYVTSDPIGLRGGLNIYGYAGNDPLGLSDPLGLAPGLGGIAGEGLAADGVAGEPVKPKADDADAYTDKVAEVLKYALESLDGAAKDEMAGFVQKLIDNAAVIGGIMAAVVVANGTPAGPVVDGVLLVGSFLIAGYEGARFLVGLVETGFRLSSTELCDAAALERMGGELADSLASLGSAVAEGVLFGSLSRLGDAVKAIKEYEGDGAIALWRKLREKLGIGRPQVAGLCSFAGDTLVSTRDGYRAIEKIEPGRDEVWARDEATGASGWRAVLARYQNRYDDTVRVTVRDADGTSQTITSNRIHPYFARIVAGALIATSSVTAIASEGHVYAGEIEGGAWVDAQHLEAGQELLGNDGSWQSVESVTIEAEPLEAFNLTVEGYSTYFVAGNESADAVWVHNSCYDTLPGGYRATEDPTKPGQTIYVGPKPGDVELYQGDDGRYYELVERTGANGTDEGPNNPNNTRPSTGPLNFDEKKFEYLFGRSTSGPHNTSRSRQLNSNLLRLGVYDSPEGRKMLIDHFEADVSNPNNVVNSYNNIHGTFEVRESLFQGPSGKFIRLDTTYMVLADGTRVFVTIIPKS